MFDPEGSTGRLRACPFLGTWRALLSREALVLEWLMVISSVFFWIDDLGMNLQEWLSDVSGERLSGSVMERSLTTTPWSAWWRARSGTERIPVFWTPSTHCSPSTTAWCAVF